MDVNGIREAKRKHLENCFAVYEPKDDSVEKSDIVDAFRYNDNLKIAKKGSEIKTQIDSVVLPEIIAELSGYSAKMDSLLQDCGKAPAHGAEEWDTCGMKIDIPYKRYEWNETYIPEKVSGIGYGMVESFSATDAQEKKRNIPENAGQAQAREEYNQLFNKYCRCKCDEAMCDILKNNVKDGKEYELTPKQLIALGFK